MKRNAMAIVGLNYGDEGKGSMVDHMSSDRDVVVKHNGGSQAGHTVVHPIHKEKKFIFSQYGSGTFRGAATYFAPQFIVNPVYLSLERDILLRNNLATEEDLDRVWAHPSCRVATLYDVEYNQSLEKRRGEGRHGSCGHGIFATIQRNMRHPSSTFDCGLTMLELATFSEENIIYKLEQIREWYRNERCQDDAFLKIVNDKGVFEGVVETLIEESGKIKISAKPVFREEDNCGWLIFESGQGLMLSEKINPSHYPHLTPSNTGLHNIIALCKAWDADLLNVGLMTRPYITRHGAGPLPDEISKEEFLKLFPKFIDDTNEPNEWQGSLRFAPWTKQSAQHRLGLINQMKKDTDAAGMDPVFAVWVSCRQPMDPLPLELEEVFGDMVSGDSKPEHDTAELVD